MLSIFEKFLKSIWNAAFCIFLTPFFIEDATIQNQAETSSIFLPKIGPGVLYFKKLVLYFSQFSNIQNP